MAKFKIETAEEVRAAEWNAKYKHGGIYLLDYGQDWTRENMQAILDKMGPDDVLRFNRYGAIVLWKSK